MNIYIIGPAFPLRGGLSDFDMRLASEFEHSGHQVQIISFKLLYPNFLFPGKSQYVEENEPAPQPSIRTLINTVNPCNWYKVGRVLKKERPDLIITRYWIPFLAPALGTIHRIVKKNKHTHIIALTDNVLPHEKRPGDKILTKYFVKSAHQFLCMSKSVQDDLKRFTNHPSFVLPHPMYDIYGQLIDKKEAKRTLGLKQDDRTILFFGFIRAYKGLDLLLQALAQPIVRQQNIKLILAGEYYVDPKPYHDLIDQLQIKSSIVQHTSFIPSTEIYRYFSAADVLVLPYKDATQSGITQIGFYFNKPMIATNVGALPETIQHEKFGLITQVDPIDMAQAIVRYFDEQLELSFTEAIRHERKKYEWLTFVEQILLHQKEDLH